MVCSEVRKRYGMPLEKLVWLKSFMLQEGADHFQAAVRMMQHGLAVFIFTDLEESFDMDADIAIADMLELGYCRYDHPHAYIFEAINPGGSDFHTCFGFFEDGLTRGAVLTLAPRVPQFRGFRRKGSRPGAIFPCLILERFC